MILKVKRCFYLEKCTVGSLYIDDMAQQIFVLEDKFREVSGKPVDDWKVFGQTAIPLGRYRVVIDWSDHFKRNLPHLLAVPGFDGVRIHPGNTDADTEGCILLGLDWEGLDFIGRSREAFQRVLEKITAAIARNEEVWIEIVLQ